MSGGLTTDPGVQATATAMGALPPVMDDAQAMGAPRPMAAPRPVSPRPPAQTPAPAAPSGAAPPALPAGARSENDIVQSWIEMGYPAAAAIGIARNAIRESGGKPTVLGDYTNGTATSFGTYQHHGPRWEALKTWAAQNGLNPNDGKTQDKFAHHELQSQMPGLQAKLMGATDPNQAYSMFMQGFERPAGSQAGAYPIAQGNQILAQMARDSTEGRAKIAKLEAGYKPVDVKDPPKPPDHDPLQTFGSALGIFLQVASTFSRTPGIAAMNSMAGAIDASKKGKWEDYKAHYEQWKENTANMFKAHDEYAKDLKAAMEMMTHNMSAGKSMAEVAVALAGDERAARHLAQSDHIALDRHVSDMNEAKAKAQTGAPLAFASAQLETAMRLREAAGQSGDPVEIAKAQANVDHWNQEVARLNAAKYGGAARGAAGQPQMVRDAEGKERPAIWDAPSRQWLEPGTLAPLPGQERVSPMGKTGAPKDVKFNLLTDRDGTQYLQGIGHDGKPINQTLTGEPYTPQGASRVGTAEDPGVAQRRDAQAVAKREHEDRLAEIAERRDVSTNERAAAALEERKRHALETERQAGEKTARSEAFLKSVTPAQLDLDAKLWLRTGKDMPGIGGTGYRMMIHGRGTEIAAAQGATVDDIITGRTVLHANAGALNTITRQKTLAEAYERGAGKELDLVVQRIPKTYEPLSNQMLTRWVRTGESNFGNTETARFHAVLVSALDEYAKVLSGATGAAASSDASRAQAASLIPEGATAAQIVALVADLKLGMSFKIEGYNEEIKALTGSIRGGASFPTPPPDAVATLKANPGAAAHFDEVFGPGAAKRVLGR